MAAKKSAKKVPKGIRMTAGSKWNLQAQAGRKRQFAGTLLGTFNLGTQRVAIFSVPKRTKAT